MSTVEGETPEAIPQGETPKTPTQAAPIAPQQPAGVTPDTAARIAKLEADLASANAHIETLKSENIEKRKAAKIAEDDRTALAAFRELAPTPGELKTVVDGAKAAEEKAANLEREKVANEAARVAGLKPDVLSDLAQSKGFILEVREVEVTGKDGKKATEKQAFAKFKEGDKDAEKPLSEYIAQHLAAYEPALKADGQPAQTVRMVAQSSGPQTKQFDEEKARKSQAPLYAPTNF